MGILGKAAFSLGRFHGTHVYSGFEGALCTVVAFDVGVEDEVVFIEE